MRAMLVGCVAVCLAACSGQQPDATTGNGVYPYVNTSELGALQLFGRSAEAQQAFGGKEASIIFSPSRTMAISGSHKLIDGSNGLSCTLPDDEYARLAALPNPFPLVQGKLGIFSPGGEVEIENCEIVAIDGAAWEKDFEAGKFPEVQRLISPLGREMAE
ncbi:MAG TPA: hypothetical protein VI168_15580 [Croceibacterium sp.]